MIYSIVNRADQKGNFPQQKKITVTTVLKNKSDFKSTETKKKQKLTWFFFLTS